MIHNDTFRKAQLISAVALFIVTWLLSLGTRPSQAAEDEHARTVVRFQVEEGGRILYVPVLVSSVGKREATRVGPLGGPQWEFASEVRRMKDHAGQYSATVSFKLPSMQAGEAMIDVDLERERVVELVGGDSRILCAVLVTKQTELPSFGPKLPNPDSAL